MSRIIKFRAWNTKMKKMFSAEQMGQDELCINPDGRGFVNVHGSSTKLSQYYPEMIPMQFTGLLDKNGKEIYEGDIVKGLIDDEEHTWEITWEEDGDFHTCGWTIDSEQASEGEVVGNIHDNPELLK